LSAATRPSSRCGSMGAMSRSLSYPLHATTLANGLRVVVNPDRAAPIVAVNLWYDVGSRDEDPGHTGFAHLFEHIMFQGSAHVSSGEHLSRMQSAGGSVNATTWFDRTNYFETIPTGALDLALWLEADRLATLPEALTAANFENQRDVVKEEKRQRYDNQPYGDAIERLVSLVFPPDHPYGHTTIGSMADLDASIVDDAVNFFRRHYLPGTAVLTLVGEVDPERGFELAERYFGAIPAGIRPERTVPAALPPLIGRPRQDVSADVPQEAVYRTWRLPARGTRDFDAVDLALSVLGGGQTSRLFGRLVREEALAETAGAAAMPLIGGNSFGYAVARALDGVASELIETVIDDEIGRLLADGPTDAEIARAKVQFEREWLTELASFDGRADLFGAYATLHGDPTKVATRIADVASVTTEEVAAAARLFLGADAGATLTYRKADQRG
jgi:zinc protease